MAYGSAVHTGGGWLSVACVYLGAYLVLVVGAICIAAGLFYLAEVAEEYSRVTRAVLKVGTGVVLALTLALALVDNHPRYCLASSFVAHLSYAALLPKFPYFEVSAPPFVLSVLLLLLSTCCWTYHFYYFTYASLEFVFGFMCVLVFFVPFGIGLACGANEGALPSNVGLLRGGGVFPGGGMAKRTRSGGINHLHLQMLSEQQHLR